MMFYGHAAPSLPGGDGWSQPFVEQRQSLAQAGVSELELPAVATPSQVNRPPTASFRASR